MTLGFSDGQIHFTWCQAARECELDCRCLTIRRESAVDDAEWQKTLAEADEFYPEISALGAGSILDLAAGEKDGSVDILLIDDCDRGEIAQTEWEAWRPKLSSAATILFHGINLGRDDPPRRVWSAIAREQKFIEFPNGLGLGAIVHGDFFPELIGSPNERKEIEKAYGLIGDRIDAKARAARAERENIALRLRQVWLDTLLADQRNAQDTIDELTRQVADLRAHAERAQAVMNDQKNALRELRRDRGKAQVVIDSLVEQLRASRDANRQEFEKIKEELRAKKRILKMAKSACRKNGRCFQEPIAAKDKPRRSIPEKILRELKRIPANLSGKKHQSTAKAAAKASPKLVEDRYAKWIAEHEPDAAGLTVQRVEAQRLTSRPKISLLLPIHDPPLFFLRELRASLAAQTYDHFEICAVNAASKRNETRECLAEWKKEEPRLRLEVLAENFGIAENTNRALALASGDFVVCIDHDDLLPPFALFELASAIAGNPEGEIFYSDEDRLNTEGKRHSPFFKPEWNPELLLSFMYVGHLTAYRRDLVERVGKFRKEFDFSQDYDFALRATELAREIVHIPHVLYHWREHPASGAAGGKPHARKSNLAALEDAMKRRGLAAEVMEYPTANRARLKISAWPKVSIVIPTDSAMRGQACVEELPRRTSYPHLEIVIVTNSHLAETLKSLTSAGSEFRFVTYDRPFNFSEKCNLGAAAAVGTRLIFLNDDVAGAEADWIQNLIEQLENPEVGAVSPKLLYADGKIQHAGLVTGVRDLVGTACHQWPSNSTDYFNMAQSLRAASALSGACLAMRRADFFAVGPFDVVNAPVAHSDFDLCFKIRAAGLRCVYTPFVTMTHRGHESIGAEEEEKKIARDERAGVFLLKRWPQYIMRDPYFTDNMRDWLYSDSPTPLRMFSPNEYKIDPSGPDLLFVSHDLSLSGAPLLLLQLADWCRQRNIFVVVMSPNDGPLRKRYQEIGVPLIIDPLVATGHESFSRLAHEFHCVLANTIKSEAAVRAASGKKTPVIFWVHETEVGEHYLQADAKLRLAVASADLVLAPCHRTAAVYQPYAKSDVACLPYGIPEARKIGAADIVAEGRFRFLVLGSIEPRKGQDVFLEAVAALPKQCRERAEFHLIGRVMDPGFNARLQGRVKDLKNVFFDGPRSHQDSLAALTQASVLVCSSRDEALPVTILEALSLAKPVISTAVGGIAEMLKDGREALLVRPEDPAGLAKAMQRLLDNLDLANELGQNGRATFEKKFTLDRFGTDFCALVNELMAKSKGGRSKNSQSISSVSL